MGMGASHRRPVGEGCRPVREKHATNGVILNSGTTNEASAKNGAQGVKESTDGVLYNCIFNSGRLEGITEEWASLHMGQDIQICGNPPGTSASLRWISWSTTDGWRARPPRALRSEIS